MLILKQFWLEELKYFRGMQIRFCFYLGFLFRLHFIFLSAIFPVYCNWSQREIDAALCTNNPDSSDCDVVVVAIGGLLYRY
jgi:hypothetical protein